MTRFVCPNCGTTIQLLSGVAICLNLSCKLGHTLTENKSTSTNLNTESSQHEQSQSQISADEHRADQPPVRGDQGDS